MTMSDPNICTPSEVDNILGVYGVVHT
jgi:hypothetical protein